MPRAYRGGQGGTPALLLFLILWKTSRDSAISLRHIRHSGHMRIKYLRHLPWIVSTLSLILAWVALIWTALEVSSIVLANLHQIVELAQLYPEK